MEKSDQGLRADEIAAQRLRRLLESRGYRRVIVGRFEEYSLYMENKNFLKTDSIITFMDPDGRLLALKPDVTLSVVKNISQNASPAAGKLYYIDEVYRLSRETREYKILGQFGVELLGQGDVFSGIEIVDLALRSLELLGGTYVLDLSHLGFVSTMLEHLELDPFARDGVMGALHAKSPHTLSAWLERADLTAENRNRILALCGLHGSFGAALPKARELVVCDKMAEALDELEQLCAALDSRAVQEHVNLDFSVVNDVDYYNGLIFRGYVQGVPKVALSGGRYDNLMKRMGKQSGALGFAVYLSELTTRSAEPQPEFDFDLLVTYPEGADYAKLLSLTGELTARGRSVRLEREGVLPGQIGTFRQHCRFDGNTLREEPLC